MKKTIKLAVVAAMALGTTSAFATNGANLIGIGAKARGMGGVGIGMSHGAESALANPALISSVEGTEIQFGGTLFMPDVETTNTLQSPAGSSTNTETSAADLSVIPSISIASKVNDNFYWGIGMWGTAGMGVDYRGADEAAAGGTHMQMVTNLQLMQFGVPLTYAISGFSVGITPVLQYGSLDINYEYPGSPNPLDPNSQGDTIGAGVGQDLQFGVNIGAAYEIAGITMGATYKSQIDMDYENVMGTTISPFTQTGYTNNKLSTPAEIGLGVSYKIAGNTIAVDYKQIKWSSAKGFEDFEWKDQNVFALGYEYAAESWAARVGYNYAKSPIEEQTVVNPATDLPNSAGLQPGTVNTFNLLGFPATTTSHLTVGGTYGFNKQASVDLAFVYAPETTETFTNFTGAEIETKHSQTSVAVGLNYVF